MRALPFFEAFRSGELSGNSKINGRWVIDLYSRKATKDNLNEILEFSLPNLDDVLEHKHTEIVEDFLNYCYKNNKMVYWRMG